MSGPLLEVIDGVVAAGHPDDAKVAISIGLLRQIGAELRARDAGDKTVAIVTGMVTGDHA